MFWLFAGAIEMRADWRTVRMRGGRCRTLSRLVGTVAHLACFVAMMNHNGAAMAAGPCVPGGVCCVGNVCGTLDQFGHNADVACLRAGALDNPNTAESIRAGGDCLAAKIMTSRVEAAIEAHEHSVEAQQKLRAELESHPDALEFQFQALTPKIKKFNAALPEVLRKLPAIEDRYRAITARMADYLNRKRQLAGYTDYRFTAARNQISVKLSQGPIATNQVYFRAQTIQRDFENNIVPLRQQVIDLEKLCGGFSDEDQLQSICKANAAGISEFKRNFDDLSQKLTQLESGYKAEQRSQQQIIDASSRIP